MYARSKYGTCKTTEFPQMSEVSKSTEQVIRALQADSVLADLNSLCDAYEKADRSPVDPNAVSPLSSILLGNEIGALVASKNLKYGDAFKKCEDLLSLLYPDGIKRDQYRDMLFILRVFDKLTRLATSLPSDEENPAKDIAGYAILKTLYDRLGGRITR